MKLYFHLYGKIFCLCCNLEGQSWNNLNEVYVYSKLTSKSISFEIIYIFYSVKLCYLYKLNFDHNQNSQILIFNSEIEIWFIYMVKLVLQYQSLPSSTSIMSRLSKHQVSIKLASSWHDGRITWHWIVLYLNLLLLANLYKRIK